MNSPAMRTASPLEKPGDFDAYWNDTLAELERIPLDIELSDDDPRQDPSDRREAATGKNVAVAKLNYLSISGKRPTGWLFRPLSTPMTGALLFLPGYSATCGSPLIQAVLAQVAEQGFTVLAIDPRGQGASRSEQSPDPKGKLVTGPFTPEAYIYRGIIADCVRAVDVLIDQAGVDSIGVFGHSQGGGLALITASLAQAKVRAVGCMIPFLTHFAHAFETRLSTGPYREIYDFAMERPEEAPLLRRALGYVDTLHHAPRVQAPTLVSVGLEDTTCPPHTVYALFERLQCTRSLLVFPDLGHSHSPDFYHHELAWFHRYLVPGPEGGFTLERLGLRGDRAQ